MHSPKDDDGAGGARGSHSPPPQRVIYKCASCRNTVVDMDDWCHHFEMCPARSLLHAPMADMQDSFDNDDNQSSHSHMTIYIGDTDGVEVSGASALCARAEFPGFAAKSVWSRPHGAGVTAVGGLQ